MKLAILIIMSSFEVTTGSGITVCCSSTFIPGTSMSNSVLFLYNITLDLLLCGICSVH